MTFETFATEELFSVAKKLSDAADERIRVAALAAADAARAEADQKLAAAQADAEATLARARMEAEAAVAQIRAESEALLAESRAQAEIEIANARAQDGAAERLLEEAAQELARAKADADAEMARLRAKGDADVAAMRAAAESEIVELRTAANNAARTNAAYGTMIDKLRNDQTQLAADNERLAAENAAFTYERADVLERAQASHRGPLLLRLRRAWRAIADASTVDDVLAAAGSGLDDAELGAFVMRDNAVVFVDKTGFQWNNTSDDEASNLVEVLRTHTAMRLARLETELKASAELRAYAQMLVDEVEYVYEADAGAGTADGARLDRLTENLRCARQIYQQRVTLDGPAAAALLEEVLQRTRERKAAQPFGRDLELAMAPQISDGRRTA